jgi:serine/threonine-protein kinase RsbW
MESFHKEVTLYGLRSQQSVIDHIIEDLQLEDDAFDVRLILVEAVTNAHYHGNQSDGSKPIMVRYSLEKECLSIQVEDSGEGTGTLVFPEQMNTEDLLEEGGRGLFLIRCLSDHVEMIRNTIHINKMLTLEKVPERNII